MGTLIKLKIDVTKIDKSRLFAGQKGKYLDLDVWLDEDKPDQFGNTASVAHAQSKEEREAKKDKIFLGNGKVWWRSPGAGSGEAAPAAGGRAAPQTSWELADDVPF